MSLSIIFLGECRELRELRSEIFGREVEVVGEIGFRKF